MTPTPVNFVQLCETYRIENQRLREEVKRLHGVETVLPCPFCYNYPTRRLDRGCGCWICRLFKADWWVECEHCNITKKGKTPELALDKWNKRFEKP